MEHNRLEQAFLIGSVSVGVAGVLGAVMLSWWRRARRQGRSFLLAAAGLVAVAGTSTGWLVYQRHQKCGPTVARTLCESPLEWLRSR